MSLAELRIDEIAKTKLQAQEETLTINGLPYAMQAFTRISVISIGKAASSMWDAIVPIVQSSLYEHQAVDGIIVGPVSPFVNRDRVRFFEGGHPFPNQSSLDAAQAILECLASCDEQCFVLFLISGGSSAMVEQALDPTMRLDDVIEFYRSLVGSGLSIEEMNILRKHFSSVKGGRLAQAAHGATQCTLLISDVPADALHVVGSGPSLPDPSTAQECRAIIERNEQRLRLSPKLLDFFRSATLPETPKADDSVFSKSLWSSLISSDDLSAIAARFAAQLGFHVVVDNRCDEWEYHRAAIHLVDELQRLRQLYPRICLISVGEILVTLPVRHGVGGRNQQFVLESTRLLHERRFAASILSGGSDGIDGNSPAAGAVGDQTTLDRAAAAGHSLSSTLEAFDSFPLLYDLGDAVLTGPTGNNVRDLRILLSVE